METQLMQQIKEILSEFPQYWQGDELQRPIVIDDLKNYDALLIVALLKNQKIRENYSIKAGDVVVFKVQEFIDILRYKDYWTDSYTKYSNTIGLSSEGKYLQYNTDVVLDFPYKDCVLEGGMTKEDTGKEEVFYNEVIARDEIDTLLAPKAFVNVKKYDADGEHKVDSFSNEDNLIIKGNNLLALHSLKERYAGKVKLIYIDPPYNTGGDSFKYNDRFNHSTWLIFMKNRFSGARDLLKDNGVIFVQCDDNEQAYLKVLMDELFGRDSFVSTIHCQMSTTQGMKVKAAQNGNIVKNAEYILVYSKDGHKNVALNLLYDLRPEYDEHYSLYLKKDGMVGQLKELYDYRFPKDLNNKKALTLKEAFRKSEEFAEIVRTHLAEIVRSDKVTGFDLSIDLESGKWKEVERNGRKYILTLDRNGKIRQLLRLQDSWGKTDNYKREEGLRKIRGDWWDGFYLDMGNVGKEGAVDFKNGKKSERLVSQIIKMATNEGDIVLDYHLGSGTTAAVAHKMNRQYIGIEQMDYINTVSVPRLQKVIEGEQGGISKDVNWQGGGSFVYVELMELNQVYMNKIDQATTKEELVNLWDELEQNADLNFQLDKEKLVNELLKAHDEEESSATFNDLAFDEQKEIFKKALDKNQLYVPYSEIEDKNVIISDNDKAFNHSFYNNEEE